MSTQADRSSAEGKIKNFKRNTITHKGESIALTKSPLFRLKDIRDMVNWLNNPSVMQYSEQRHKIHNLQSQQKYLASFDGKKSIIWGIFKYVKKEMYLVGTVTAHCDLNNYVANMGIMIGPDFQDRGYGMAAWKNAMMDLWLEDYYKVEAGCMEANVPMCWICAKSGMVLEGRIGSHFWLDGNPVDMLLYGKLRSE